jgi:hypothetical protein
MNAGLDKAAKRLFARALQDPTENAVAQAEFASTLIRGIPLEPRHLQVANSFEARARDAWARSSWREALQESVRWLLDQPFSSVAASLGSYLANITLGDYAEGARIARLGLNANPADTLLRNNLVVSLAMDGKVVDARREFDLIEKDPADPRLKATVLATAGLLSYRTSSFEDGRKSYQRALDMLTAPTLRRMRAIAALHRSYEELLARGPHIGEYLTLGRELAQGLGDPEVRSFSSRVDQLAKSLGVLL